MSSDEWQGGEDISLFAVATTLLRSRWRIARWALYGALLALLIVLLRPATYIAIASFVPQSQDNNRSGLASLAGQFGVSIPTGNASASPEFYVTLVKTHVLLQPIAEDTLVVPKLKGQRVSMTDLLDVRGPSEEIRRERAVGKLQQIIAASANKATGVVELSVRTKQRSVSLAIVSALVSGVSAYNEHSRQGQAAAERKFVGERLQVVSAELRVAEDRLAEFLRTNREYSAPQVAVQRERLQRDIGLRQQLYSTLTQSFEEARIREVRDTPVISTLETPFAPKEPTRSGRVLTVVLGLLAGILAGIVVVLTSAFVQRRRAEGGADASEFFAALEEAKVGGAGRRTKSAARTGP
jgi:uncharacterized protein involved in exopolysaccharide biosynthesis